MARIGSNIDLTAIKRSGVDPIVYETYKELKKFKEAPARRDAMERREEAWKAAIENEMWDEKDKAEMKATGQIPVTYNKLNKGVQGNAAIVTSTKPEIKVYPTRLNDPYVAELIKWGLDWVWYRNDGNDVVYSWVEEKNLGGIGWVTAELDENRGIFGRIMFSEEDPTIFYFDPKARDNFFRDTHIIKAQLRTVAYIREEYPDIKDEDLKFETVDADMEQDGKITDTVVGADNYAINPGKSDGDVTRDEEERREVWEIEAYWLKTEKEWWAILATESDPEPTPVRLKLEEGQKPKDVLQAWREQNEDPNNPFTMAELWERKMRNRYLRIIVGKKIIEQNDPESGKKVKERRNPYGLDSDGDPVLPMIALKGQRTLSAYCMSQTTYAIPINKAYNKRHAQFLYAASKGLNAPVVRGDDSRWTGPPDKPGSELIVTLSTTAETSPRRLSPGTVDLSGLAMLMDKDEQSINDQYDLPDVLRGKVPKGQDNMSGRLGLALQDSASVMNNPHLRSLETAMVLLAKVLLAIMLKNWPRQMWERLIEGPDAEDWKPPAEDMPQQEAQPGTPQDANEKEEIKKRWEKAIDTVMNEGIELIDLDVRITAGSSLPTNRMARNAEAREMFGMGLVDRQAALEHSNYPGAKEIADRMDKREEMMAQAGMMGKRK